MGINIICSLLVMITGSISYSLNPKQVQGPSGLSVSAPDTTTAVHQGQIPPRKKEWENEVIEIFGVVTKADELSVLKNLSEAGVLKIDSLVVEEGKFKFAIVEFAGVKFGFNPGFNLLTSRKDRRAVKNIIRKIRKYYGQEEEDDPGVYIWNRLPPPASIPKPMIRLRPLRKWRIDGEEGLVMFWYI